MTHPPPGIRRPRPTPIPTPSPAPDPRREAVRAFTDRYGEPPEAVAAIPPPGAETTAPAAEPLPEPSTREPAQPPAG